MTEKRLIQYKVLCDDYEEVRRILFEIIETGEEIEGYHQIQEWVDNLYKENEQLKKVLGAILLEVKQDITNTNQTGEIKVFINPNSFEMISEVLRKYGALKDWYE